MKWFRKICIWILTLASFKAYSDSLIGFAVDDESISVVNWSELEVKLLNQRMPRSYYNFLNQNGIYSADQLLACQDEGVKSHLLDMYRHDRLIILSSDRTRSMF